MYYDVKLKGNFLFIIILAVIGLLVSSYLFATKISDIPIICDVSSCDVVNNSEYSHLFGIPVSFFGVGYYGLCLALTLLKRTRVLFMLSMVGVLFSAYLSALEAFVIHAWCQWCLVSAWLTVCIFVLAYRLRLAESASH